MTLPRVIVHADAFGCHPSFNEGVERAHRFGLVTSAGIAAEGEALDDAVQRSRNLPALDLGLHFLLRDNRGHPLTIRRLCACWLHGELSSREAAGRLRSQLDLLRRVHRLSLSHIIVDPGLDCFPPLMRVVSAVAMEYDISGVRARSEVAAAFRPAARSARQMVRLYHRWMPEHCLDRQGCLTPISFMTLLRNAAPGVTEIICRPGSINDAGRQAMPHGNWEGDLQAVCDDAARACVRMGRVTLATWRDG